MSQQAVFNFFELISKDKTLEEQIKKISAAGFLALAKSNGFNFSLEHLKQVTTHFSSLKDHDFDQLSDEDLDQVAGGFPVALGIVCSTIGVICAIDALACHEGWWGDEA